MRIKRPCASMIVSREAPPFHPLPRSIRGESDESTTTYTENTAEIQNDITCLNSDEHEKHSKEAQHDATVREMRCRTEACSVPRIIRLNFESHSLLYGEIEKEIAGSSGAIVDYGEGEWKLVREQDGDHIGVC